MQPAQTAAPRLPDLRQGGPLDRSVALAGLPADSESSKVRMGQVGESRLQLGSEVVAELDAVWRQRVTPALGFASYADMIATLRPA